MSFICAYERVKEQRQQVMDNAREPHMGEESVTDSESESVSDLSPLSSTGSESLSDDTERRGGKRKRKKRSLSRQYLRRNKSELLVTCGNKDGVLNVEKFNGSIGKVQKCIFSEDQWFTPNEFERFGGKARNKKWKISIFCDGIPLQKLLEDGHLSQIKKRRVQNEQESSPESSPVFGRLRRRKCSQGRRQMFPSSSDERDDDDEDEDDDDNDDDDEEDDDDDDDAVDMSAFEGSTLPVTCGSDSGILHKSRFASGRCGRCIRTEHFWLTPEDFIRLNKPDGTWRKDIVTHGTPLGKLIMERVLEPHTVNCDCDVCQELDQYSNDDVCFVCDSESEEDLVCCDGCPRAFHSHCHLPALDEDSVGQWSCTFCMMKNLESSSQKTQQDVLSSPVSPYTLHCQCLLLHLLHESRTDPCTSVPEYSENICGPMMLGRVKMNLENNDYQTVQEFVKDVEYVFHQCTSNGDNDFSRKTSRLKEIFKKEFESIFKYSISNIVYSKST